MNQYQEGVDQPQHYTEHGLQPIQVIEAWGLGFLLGTTVKYIGRAGKKPGESRLKDLEKAHWYLSREIEQERQKELTINVDIRKERQDRLINVLTKTDIQDPYDECPNCHGRGVGGAYRKKFRCPNCSGTGKVLKKELHNA